MPDIAPNKTKYFRVPVHYEGEMILGVFATDEEMAKKIAEDVVLDVNPEDFYHWILKFHAGDPWEVES